MNTKFAENLDAKGRHVPLYFVATGDRFRRGAMSPDFHLMRMEKDRAVSPCGIITSFHNCLMSIDSKGAYVEFHNQKPEGRSCCPMCAKKQTAHFGWRAYSGPVADSGQLPERVSRDQTGGCQRVFDFGRRSYSIPSIYLME